MSRLMILAKQLIDALPDTGATVVVIRSDIGRWLKKGVRERRGFSLSKQCRFITIYHLNDCNKLLGAIGHIVLDHSFLDYAKPAVKQRVSELVHGIQLMEIGSMDLVKTDYVVAVSGVCQGTICTLAKRSILRSARPSTGSGDHKLYKRSYIDEFGAMCRLGIEPAWAARIADTDRVTVNADGSVTITL